VPIILVATYPAAAVQERPHRRPSLCGLLNLAIGRIARCHLPSAERRGAARVAAAVLCASTRGVPQIAGNLVPIAAVLLGACLLRPYTSARLIVIAVSVAAALALLAAGSRFGASDSDQASTVFLPKTLFCNHLNIVLASDAARREIGRRPATTPTPRWRGSPPTSPRSRVAGPCSGSSATRASFDTALDRDVADDTGNASARPQPIGASSWPRA